MNLLLLQARNNGDPAAAHERNAFADVIGTDVEQVETWSLLDGAPPDDRLLTTDCILVGGAGHFGVAGTIRDDWIIEFIELMGRLTTLDVPVFASCFGFQGMIVACGGRVVSDKTRAEFGTFDVTLTDEGRRDSLFGRAGPRFQAQFGHSDHAAEFPSGFVNLAGTDRNEYQAARVTGRRIYMTQFHPELTMESNRERARMYLDSYAEAGFVDSPEEVMKRFRQSHEASGLLRRFIREDLGLTE